MSNQCDGCKQGFPIENGIHINPQERGSFNYNHMCCTKSRYEGDGKDKLPCGHLTEYQYFHPALIGSMRWRCRVCDGLE